MDDVLQGLPRLEYQGDVRSEVDTEPLDGTDDIVMEAVEDLREAEENVLREIGVCQKRLSELKLRINKMEASMQLATRPSLEDIGAINSLEEQSDKIKKQIKSLEEQLENFRDEPDPTTPTVALVNTEEKVEASNAMDIEELQLEIGFLEAKKDELSKKYFKLEENVSELKKKGDVGAMERHEEWIGDAQELINETQENRCFSEAVGGFDEQWFTSTTAKGY
eukprot:TRINITY_DN457_c0_g1_i2.p1 TRINITY_DN457_c0_g1~~TRINITY_DN457_c0_g1_i2.p1  ORF type:complete len:222 (-),score=57.57 TRINITY_DN457_c0_g1_i2:1037-1702(-)